LSILLGDFKKQKERATPMTYQVDMTLTEVIIICLFAVAGVVKVGEWLIKWARKE